MKFSLVSQALVAAFGLSVLSMSAEAGCINPEPLKFRPDGTFRILQITDTQDDHNIDFRTPELIRRAIREEQPDLVVCSGDCISGGDIANDQQVREAIDAYITPVEEAGVPFIIAFGNHDEDAYVRGSAPNMDEEAQLEYYRNNFTCNINQPSMPNITGTGNMVTFVYGSQSGEDGQPQPKLAVWSLDSGRYAPNPIAGQNIRFNDNHWDWIRQDQVQWYRDTSERFERRYGENIPGIMFFHIPLYEFDTMWIVDKGLFGLEDAVPPTEAGRYSVEEERHECVCTGPFNSALYAAAQERGDILGMFVGHDHINNYVGNFHGILLGYGASSGFGTYGFSGNEEHRLRGIRVHDFVENDVRAYATEMTTYFKRAGSDYGMCMAPEPEDCQGDAYFQWVPAESSAQLAATAAPLPAANVAQQESVESEVKIQEDGSLRAVGPIQR